MKERRLFVTEFYSNALEISLNASHREKVGEFHCYCDVDGDER